MRTNLERRGTIKNRMSVLRWWAQKVDRQNVIARQNDHYGIPDRIFVSHASKAIRLHGEALDRLAFQHGVHLAYHDSIAAGWPLILALEGNHRSVQGSTTPRRRR